MMPENNKTNKLQDAKALNNKIGCTKHITICENNYYFSENKIR